MMKNKAGKGEGGAQLQTTWPEASLPKGREVGRDGKRSRKEGGSSMRAAPGLQRKEQSGHGQCRGTKAGNCQGGGVGGATSPLRVSCGTFETK